MNACLYIRIGWGLALVLCQTMHTMGALHCLGLAPPSDPTDQWEKKVAQFHTNNGLSECFIRILNPTIIDNLIYEIILPLYYYQDPKFVLSLAGQYLLFSLVLH